MSIKKPMDKKISYKEKIESNEVLYLVDAFITLLKEYGSFIGRIGELEKKNPDLFKRIKDFGSPEVLESFVEEVPPEITGLMLKTFIRMAKLSQIKDVMALSADEKIEHAKEIELIIKDLLEIVKKAETLSKARSE